MKGQPDGLHLFQPGKLHLLQSTDLSLWFEGVGSINRWQPRAICLRNGLVGIGIKARERESSVPRSWCTGFSGVRLHVLV